MAISKLLNKNKEMISSVFRLIFANSIWMLIEQCLRLLSGLLIGIVIARYLGVNQFGVYSFILSLFLLANLMTQLGFDKILIKKFLTFGSHSLILKHAVFLALIFSTCIFIPLFILTVMTLKPDDNISYSLAVILSLALPFKALLPMKFG